YEGILYSIDTNDSTVALAKGKFVDQQDPHFTHFLFVFQFVPLAPRTDPRTAPCCHATKSLSTSSFAARTLRTCTCASPLLSKRAHCRPRSSWPLSRRASVGRQPPARSSPTT